MGPNDPTDWHYDLSKDGTVTRGRAYNIGDSDSWRNYWDGDGMVGFTVHYRPGGPDIEMLAEDDDNHRAVAAWRAERNGERNSEGSLDRLAPRLTDSEDSTFICVSLEPALDFYVLAWGGDADGAWRDEIENVWHGEVYRFEVQEYVLLATKGWECWSPADDPCVESYGEDAAMVELRKMFPLNYFPAEVLVSPAGA